MRRHARAAPLKGGTLRRLAQLARPHKGKLSLAAILVVTGSTASLLVPQVVGHLVSAAARNRSSDIGGLIGLGLSLAIVGAVSSSLANLVISSTGEGILAELRGRLARHALGLGLSFFESNAPGRLIARMTSDFDAMEDLVQQGLQVLVSSGVTFAVALVLLPVFSPELFGIVALTVPPLCALSIWYQRRSQVAYLEVRDKISQTLTVIQEGLIGIKVIQAFNSQMRATARFRDKNVAQLSANLHAVALSLRFFPVLEAAGVVSTGVVLGVGGLLVVWGQLPLAQVVAFLLYLGLLYSPIQQIGQLFNQVQSSGAALSKIFEILETRADVEESSPAHKAPRRPDLLFDRVWFRYPGAEAWSLREVSFEVPFGTHLALVGPTGAGKSTIAKLAARFYDPVRGRVAYAGIDLRCISLEELRRLVVLLPQEGFVFAGTILDNLAVVGPSDEREIRRRLEQSGLLEIFEASVLERAGGFGADASRLSAGQHQILNLARVALLDPQVLILDEATASVDPFTESALVKALDRVSRERTRITIVHRIPTAMTADIVAVVEAGTVSEIGSPSDLLMAGRRFAELHRAYAS